MSTSLTHGGLPDGVSPFKLCDLVAEIAPGTCKKERISATAVRLLQYFIRACRQSDFEPGKICGTWEQPQSIAATLRISTKVLHNAEAQLRKAGLIERTYSPHARRSGKRHDGTIIALSGISLRPLIDGWAKWQARREVIELQARAVFCLKQEVAALNREARASNDPRTIERACEILPRGRVSRINDVEKLEALRDALEALLVLVEVPSGATKSSDQTEEIVTPNIPDSNTSKNRSGAPRQRDAKSPTLEVTPRMVVGIASPDFRSLLPVGRPPRWCDLIDASALACRWHGISEPVFGEACEMLGRERAAICVMIVDRNARLPGEHRYRARSGRKCFAGLLHKPAGLLPLLRVAQSYPDEGSGEGSSTPEPSGKDDRGGFGAIVSAALARMSKEFGEKTDSPASTVHAFLGRYARILDGRASAERVADARAELSGALVMVDEASQIGTDRLARLIELANRMDVGKLVLAGDVKQLPAIEAGKPFAQLQGQDIGKSEITENLRAQTPQMQAINAALDGGDIDKAFAALKPATTEVEAGKIAGVAADMWASLPKEERDTTVLLAAGRAMRSAGNEAAQTSLRERGEIGARGLKLDVLDRVTATREGARLLKGYHEGRLVAFETNLPSQGFRRGDRGEIVDVRDGKVELHMAEHQVLTLTKLYNVLEALKEGRALTDAERDVHDRGLVTLIRQHHDTIDTLVAEAYGWPADLSDEDILIRLVALNKDRAAEEAKGLIRWLRPEYQAPGYQAPVSQTLDLGEAAAPAPDNVLPWPDKLPEQVSAVAAVLSASTVPLAPQDVARTFRGKRAVSVTPVLDALTAIGQARRLKDGRYAA